MESDSMTVLKSVTNPAVAGPPPVISWPALNVCNETNKSAYNESSLSYEMRFNEGHVVTIVTYSILMVISAIGNITVLSIILKRRRKAGTRIHAMLMHLAIADLLVSTSLYIINPYTGAIQKVFKNNAVLKISGFIDKIFSVKYRRIDKKIL